MTIQGTTTVTGIFGCPVKHSFSPAMHNAAFKALGLDCVYVPFEVPPEGLRAAVQSLRPLGIRGVNVTIPHKERVLRYLDRVDPLAETIGSVNTVVNDEGVLTGYNTDGSGFLKDLNDQGFDPAGGTALLLGAGGAGRALAAVLAQAGAKVLITDTDRKRAEALVRRTPGAGFVPLDDWKGRIGEADLLVNATPVGMRASDPALARSGDLKKDLFVYDIVYNRTTGLLQAARKKGARHSGGLGMLLNQGVLAFRLWTGADAPEAVMRRALRSALKR